MRQAGLKWLEKLPVITERLQKHWHLRNIEPVADMSYHFVARAIDHENQPVVIKIGFDKKLILAEAEALRHFENTCFIKLLDVDKDNNALLLQQAIPGITLKNLYPEQIEYVMDSHVFVTKQIHNLPFNNHWNTVEDLLNVIDTTRTKLIPNNLIIKALKLKKQAVKDFKK